MSSFHPQITNAELYFEGNQMFGLADELSLTLPQPEMVSHEALGQIGKLNLPSRALSAATGEITFKTILPEFENQVLNPRKVFAFLAESRLDRFDENGATDEVEVITSHIGAMFSSADALGFKLGEKVARKHEFQITKLIQKSSFHTQPIVEYDPFNRIYRVNGEDVWPR